MFWTEKFKKKLEKCAHKDLVLREIIQLDAYLKGGRYSDKKVKPVRGKSADNAQKYGVTLWEWKIDSAARILFDKQTPVTVLDFSAELAHDALEGFEKLSSGAIGKVINSRSSIPTNVINYAANLVYPRRDKIHSAVLQKNLGPDRFFYPQERHKDWVIFLDLPQQFVSQNIFESIQKNDGFKLIILHGGAGTGKTLILRDIAIRLSIDSRIQPLLLVPAGVEDLLTSEGEKIDALNPTRGKEIGTFLMDDPMSIEDAEKQVQLAKSRGVPIVIAIDPVQWHEKKSRERFLKMKSQNRAETYSVDVNYRQGKQVGLPALELIRNFRTNSPEYRDPFMESTHQAGFDPFFRKSLHDVTFKEDAGSWMFYSIEEFSVENILNELLRVIEFETERSWPKVLFGTSNGRKLPVPIPELLRLFKTHVDKNLRYHVRSFIEDYDLVRGTEYESVILFIPSDDWEDIENGITSPNSSQWALLNSFLTFTTRAENRLTIFQVPEKIHRPKVFEVENYSELDINLQFQKWLENITNPDFGRVFSY